MTSDLQALLAAIVADPADDVARLVYADCLEEHGNPARARFIRLQIEAERHHPHSNARTAMEQQARELFQQHWQKWWGEVCAAVGLPLPEAKPDSRLGRLASRIGLRAGVGEPYRRNDFSLTPFLLASPPWDAFAGLSVAMFRHGFPDLLGLRGGSVPLLAKWLQVSPIASLTVFQLFTENWFDAPPLALLDTLIVFDYDPAILLRLLQPPRFGKLKCLQLMPDLRRLFPAQDFVDELAWLATTPATRQLDQLVLPVWNARAAEVLANAESLSALESLEVSFPHYCNADSERPERRLARTARSPHLAGLKELTISSRLSEVGVASVVQNPTWSGLRDLNFSDRVEQIEPLVSACGLPELESLSLNAPLNAHTADALVRSPLLKQLRSFSFCPEDGPIDRALLAALVDAVDANRIENFVLSVWDRRVLTHRMLAPLRRAFGDKLRVYPL